MTKRAQCTNSLFLFFLLNMLDIYYCLMLTLCAILLCLLFWLFWLFCVHVHVIQCGHHWTQLKATYLLTMLANVNLCDENWKVPAGSNECWNTGGKWRDSCRSAELYIALFTRGQIIRWPLLQFFKRGFESLDPYDLRPWMVWEL